MPSPRNREREGSPASLPEGNPSMAAPYDHSFTLQAIMEMQKTLGSLDAKVGGISGDIAGFKTQMEGFSDKIDKIRHWQSVVSGGAIVVAAIAVIIWSIITFVPWERVHIEGARTEAAANNRP